MYKPKRRQSSEEKYKGDRGYRSSEEENSAGDGHDEGCSDYLAPRMAKQGKASIQSWASIADGAFSRLGTVTASPPPTPHETGERRHA